MQTIRFKSPKNLENLLLNYKGIYTVDSLISNSLKYGISDGKFAIFREDGVVMAEMNEVPDIAECLVSEVKEEVLAIWEDVREVGIERNWM